MSKLRDNFATYFPFFELFISYFASMHGHISYKGRQTQKTLDR